MDQPAWHTFETAIGICTIWWTPIGITRFRLPDTDGAGVVSPGRNAGVPSGSVVECVARTLAYFEGHPIDFRDVQLDFSVVPAADATVYQELRRTEWGHTTTYGALAEAVARPGAAREIGGAMARNPWPVIVPCHRVLAAGSRLGGFSAPGGAGTKARLLELERVQLSEAQPMLPGLSR